MECRIADTHSLVVVGTTYIVIQCYGLFVFHILHIHVVDGVLALGHQPLAVHNPCGFTACLVTYRA